MGDLKNLTTFVKECRITEEIREKAVEHYKNRRFYFHRKGEMQ